MPVRFSLRHLNDLNAPQQFVRDNVLRVDNDEDEEATAVKRDLQGRSVHEVVDLALNDDLTDAERDSVFEAPIEEDDKVGLFSFTVPSGYFAVGGSARYAMAWCCGSVDSFVYFRKLL